MMRSKKDTIKGMKNNNHYGGKNAGNSIVETPFEYSAANEFGYESYMPNGYDYVSYLPTEYSYDSYKYESYIGVSANEIREKYELNRKKYSECFLKHDNCEKNDYLLAVGCGAIGGLVDAFLVGAPGDSKLGKWTDEQVDNVIKTFASKMGWSPNKNNSNSTKSAIGFLEDRFKVNYDQRRPSDVGNMFNIAPKTHHMMSLAHSPDIVGLFFSILNQFTNTASFVSEGKLITVNTKTYELQGGNFLSKLVCGIVNWFGHLLSDVAGSSGAHGRGVGIVVPFYELFALCKVGKFNTASGKKDLAEMATSIFTEGYDFRHGLAMSIPVIITEFSIKIIWAIKNRFLYEYPLKECLPSMENDNLRVMLLIGDGVLCTIDILDASVKGAGGGWIVFFMRLNLIAWYRFATLVIKEVFIRLGLKMKSSENKTMRALSEYGMGNTPAYQMMETKTFMYNIDGIVDEEGLCSFFSLYYSNDFIFC